MAVALAVEFKTTKIVAAAREASVMEGYFGYGDRRPLGATYPDLPGFVFCMLGSNYCKISAEVDETHQI